MQTSKTLDDPCETARRNPKKDSFIKAPVQDTLSLLDTLFPKEDVAQLKYCLLPDSKLPILLTNRGSSEKSVQSISSQLLY